MKHMLAVDIGNTNITVGIFCGARMLAKTKIPTHNYSLYEENIKRFLKSRGIEMKDLETVAISSVAPLALARFIMHLGRIGCRRRAIIGRDIKVPIINKYKVKSEVGQDRLVNAFAAKSIYGAPAVIIDFGTAVTFDVVSKKGEYLGGLILPGIALSLRGLYEKTALLPKVELKPASSIIGKDTVNSIRGGLLFGFGAMCDGLIAKYRGMFGNNTITIATGGNADLIKRYAGSIDIVDEDLTLKGIALTTAASTQ